MVHLPKIPQEGQDAQLCETAEVCHSQLCEALFCLLAVQYIFKS